MKKTKVIFSTDDNPLYYEFREPVCLAWENLGFEPVCINLSKKDCFIDPKIVPISNQAQIVRVLYPSLFPEDKFITSDIDMLPLNEKYFRMIESHIEDDKTILNASFDAYPSHLQKFPMCYYAGMGSVFSSITGIKKLEDIGKKMASWFGLGHKWNTDEICFYSDLKSCKDELKVKLFRREWFQGRANLRIDRDIWHYNEEMLKNHQYIDSHMLRPFSLHVDKLRPLFESVGVKI